MNAWSLQSCRACLLQDNMSAMYDLTVPETLKLYNQCSNTKISMRRQDSSLVPQHLCTMCYRLCELLQGFRERCQDTEKKLSRGLKNKHRPAPRSVLASAPVVKGEPEEQLEDYSVDKVEFHEEETYHVTTEGDPGDGMDSSENPLGEDEAEEGGDDGGGGGGGGEDDSHIWEEVVEDTECEPPSPKKKRAHYTYDNDGKPVCDKDTTGLYDHLIWGPGPNEKGVWKFFLRDVTKKYSKCLDCGRVLAIPNGSTSALRTHIIRIHRYALPAGRKSAQRTVQEMSNSITQAQVEFAGTS